VLSPNEQVEFLQKIIDRKLPVSSRAYEMTEKILFREDIIGGWKLYGKTGVGEGRGEERIGWFVGWISKGKRHIPFASCVVFPQKQETIPSFIAKNNAMEKLFWLINDLEK
jgi:beta-lactamase class D